jgi:hypothetical protein
MKLGTTNKNRTAALFSAALLLLLGVSIALRATELNSKSLWLDEFHTIDIADADNLTAVVDNLRPDFHAPAYFFIVHFLGPDLDERGRWISIIASVLTMLVGLLLTREIGFSPASQFMTMAGFACLPFQIQYTTELRPYSLLGLCTLAAIWAAFSHRYRPRIHFLLFILAATMGLYTHYLMSIVILGIGCSRLIVRPQRALPFGQLFLAGVIAVVCFLPWIISVESWIYTDPTVMVRNEVPPTAASTQQDRLTIGFLDIAVLPIRLISPIGSTLGHNAGWLVRCLSMVLALAGAATFFTVGPRAIRSTDPDKRRLAAIILVAVFNVALTLCACIWLWGRLPIQYFMTAAWVWPFLLGGLFNISWVKERGTLCLTVLLLLAGTLSLTHVMGQPRENFRKAVQVAVKMAADNDALLTAILAQPGHYNSLTPIQIYAPNTKVYLSDEIMAQPMRKCVILARSLRGNPDTRQELLEFHVGGPRRVLSRATVDRYLDVLLLSNVDTQGK